MKELKNKYSWVVDDFKNNRVKISLEHNTYAKKLFNSDDVERKIEYFLDTFSMSLFMHDIEPMKELHAFKDECGECGSYITYVYNTEKKELLDYVRNHNTDNLERTKCEVVGDYSLEIEFPTGVILCHDRLPYSYDMLKHLDSTRSLNTNLGLKERTLNHARENIFHVFVGNSCPDVFKKDDFIVVGHSSNNEIDKCSCGSDSGCDCEYEEYYPIENSKKIANICTDLWWASIVDIGVYKKLLTDYFGEDKAKSYIDELEPIKTKIKPGVYKCTNFRKDEYDDYHECPSILAQLEWVGDINTK